MSNEGGAECAICLEELGERSHRLECGHAFHPWCILRAWREKGELMRCPMCRRTAHARVKVTIGDLPKRLAAHRQYTRGQVDAWHAIGWITAFACAFWLATATFGRLGELDPVMQYLFTIVTALGAVLLHPRRMSYPNLALGNEE